MNEEFTKKVRSAAIAGWWTLLIGVIFLSLTWVAYLIFMCQQPDWLIRFWGGRTITWELVQNIWLWITAIFKMALWLLALIVIWLSLWARELKKSARMP